MLTPLGHQHLVPQVGKEVHSLLVGHLGQSLLLLRGELSQHVVKLLLAHTLLPLLLLLLLLLQHLLLPQLLLLLLPVEVRAWGPGRGV